MKFKISGFLIVVTLINLLFPQVTISSPISSVINLERSKFNLDPVTYNDELASELKLVNDSYFFGLSPKAKWINLTDTFAVWRPFNGDYLLEEPRFQKWSNWTTMFHETCRTSMVSIINYRLKQRDCYKSLKYTRIGRCKFAYAYYYQMMNPNLKSIACVLLNVRGPNVPQRLYYIQLKSFYCFQLIK